MDENDGFLNCNLCLDAIGIVHNRYLATRLLIVINGDIQYIRLSLQE